MNEGMLSTLGHMPTPGPIRRVRLWVYDQDSGVSVRINLDDDIYPHGTAVVRDSERGQFTAARLWRRKDGRDVRGSTSRIKGFPGWIVHAPPGEQTKALEFQIEDWKPTSDAQRAERLLGGGLAKRVERLVNAKQEGILVDEESNAWSRLEDVTTIADLREVNQRVASRDALRSGLPEPEPLKERIRRRPTSIEPM